MVMTKSSSFGIGILNTMVLYGEHHEKEMALSWCDYCNTNLKSDKSRVPMEAQIGLN